MKKWASALAVLVACGTFTAVAIDAEARRLGGGRNLGVQRQAVPPREAPAQPPATQPSGPVNQAVPGAGAAAQPASPAGAAGLPARPATAQAQAPAATTAGAAAQPRSGMSRWMGPVAGIAAGLGLAALLSHFGLSEAFAGILLLVLLGFGLVLLIGWIMRRSGGGQTARYAGAGSAGNVPLARGTGIARDQEPRFGGVAARDSRTSHPRTVDARVEPVLSPTGAARAQPEFDTEAFLRNARDNFTRLQGAFDTGDLASIRDVTTPEMYSQLRRDIAERPSHRPTEVVKLDSRIVEVETEGNAHWVGVRFSGLLREDGAEIATPFDEVWNLTKPVDDSSGWLLAGIQQVG